MAKMLLVIPTLNQGGAERVMSELANQWAADGHQVVIVLLVKSIPFYKLDIKVELVNLGYNLTNSKIFKFLNSLSLLFKLRKYLKNNNPDFVLSFMEKYNLFTLTAGAFLKVPIYVSDRNNPNTISPKRSVFLKKLLYPNAKGIIAQTILAKEILQKNIKNTNIQVIANPAKKSFNNLNVEKEKIILNVGRLVPEKGQHYLIEMMSILRHDQWKLVIAGDGPLKTQLKSQIRDFNLEDKVILLGSVENVDEWLSKSSIFAFSSLSEGFPNALIEAMIAQLPCVSFDCDAGPRDLIQNNINGFLVPLNDVNSLTIVVQKLIENEELRSKIGVEASKISQRLNVKKISQEYLDFCTKH